MSQMVGENVSQEFLKAEYRTGYYVSEKMKKVWAVELDLLATFAEVCERNKLNYFMDGGTLLGAVRHKGFIPWDDDVDVIMPRKDYDRLFDIGEKEFKYPYFFQTTLSEEGFFRPHAQLRNSETTGFIQGDAKRNINKGIFLDIFPLDGLPDSEKEYRWFEKRVKMEQKILWYRYNRVYSKLTTKRKAIYICVQGFFKLYPFKKFFQHFNRNVMGRYSNENTKLVGDISLDWRKNVQWPREWFSDHVYLPFEHLKLRAPICYEKVLTKQYGDFMKIPEDISAPNERSHGSVTFEPEIPYKKYFEMEENSRS